MSRDNIYLKLNNIDEKGVRRPTNQNLRNQPPRKQKKVSNTPFLIVTTFSVLIFLGLAIYLVYFNYVKRDDYISSPYNKRQENYGKDIIRGKILDKDGNVLAKTNVDDEGDETREYPYGGLYSHVVGYNVYGNTGIESKYNFDLLTSHDNIFNQIKNDFANKKNQGDNVVTTLDTNLQQTAANALGKFKGAVVCMEPKTGKVLAMYSNPQFDPNNVVENWEEYNSDEENSPMLNRATMGLYPPGSTFKIITSLEYMREDSNYNSFAYNCNGAITFGNQTISCYDGKAHGLLDLNSAFAKSCNCAFMTIGENLDAKKLRSTCESLLFNDKLPSIGSYAKSRFPLDKNTATLERMVTCMGQGKTLVSPYHMALITSAIANGGNLMKPYVVSKIMNAGGDEVSSVSPSKYQKLMSESEASNLTALMSGVVNNGTASALNRYGYSIAAKTGTAEYSDINKDKSHSWFVGFSNIENPDLVVSVVIEGSDGRASATTVAGSLFRAYHGN